MSKFSVPAAGISIEHNPKGSNGPPQIIRLRLSEQDTRDLIRHVREGGTSRFKTGRHLAIEYGTKRVAVHHGTNNHPQQVFAGPLDGSRPLYFSGKLSHSLEVQHAKEATAGTDSALEKLKNNLKQSQEERSSQQSAISGNKLLRPGHRPSPLSAGLLNSRPSSPFLSAGFSPRLGPTSAPLLSGQSQQEKIKLAAIKIPVIHLLAMEPQEPGRLAGKLRVRRTDLDQVLMKVAKDGKGGKKELKDRSFKDLDVWKFPYPSQGDRQMAIDNAISAFDRQRVEKTEHLWQMLLAKEDRGKGIYLSKLNFDKPLNPGNLTPKIAERSTDGTSTEGKSMNSLGSGDSSKRGKAPASKSTDKPKLTADQIAKNLKKIGNREAALHSGRNIPVVKETAAKKTQSTKQDPKVKSSEKVIDSDEEADAGPSIAAPVTKRKDTSQPKPLRPQKPPLHKVQPSKSPSGSGDTDRGRLTSAPAMVRTRGGKDTDIRESSKLSSAPQSRNPSRPRNGSSPVKPSPLGSSPPANTRDVDTSSNSSKGTMLSSAPSSPPSTADSSQGKKTYSPVVSAKKTEKLTNGIKRKAEAHDSVPPAKKQQPQANGTNSRNDTSRLHGLSALPGPLNDVTDRRQTTKRESPDSDASSVSEKSLTKEQIIEEAKRFHKYYAKYKELHEKVNKQKSSERKDEDVDLVWSMHKRLSDMKDKIWKDWERAEKAKT